MKVIQCLDDTDNSIWSSEKEKTKWLELKNYFFLNYFFLGSYQLDLILCCNINSCLSCDVYFCFMFDCTFDYVS